MTDPTGLQSYYPKNQLPNTIVCDGFGGVKVQIGTSNPDGSLICGIGDCIKKHEEKHISDLKNHSYGSAACAGKEASTGVGFNTACQVYQSEVNSYTEKLNCLEEEKKKSAGGSCALNQDARIKQVKAQIELNNKKLSGCGK